MAHTLSRYSIIFIAGALALFIISFAFVASAQESTITFPVSELGNCKDKKACHAYCDDLAHVTECVAFAESHGLMSTDEARQARKFSRLGGKGPGGCTSKDSCESYCEDPTHMRQCIDFAKQSGLMDEEELEEAEKVVAYLDAGGAMPGGCRGERECRAYCESGEHIEECTEFALKAGFMSEKDAEIFRKTGGKGPGGCRGKECESYCNDEAHREVCVAFALEHGLMSEEDKQRMEEGKEKAKEALQKAPPLVLACIEAALGAERVAQLKRGEGFAGPALGQVLPRCFEDVMGKERTGPFSQGVPAEARDCMRQVFGDDFEQQIREGTLDPGSRDEEIRNCMQAHMGEGFLNDHGQWERPQAGEPPREGSVPQEGWQGAPSGDPRRMFEGYREGESPSFEGEGNLRAEMEARMRAEMEAQMRSGTFDPSRLPPDYRPEGYLPPPESFNRPPEGMPPPEGFLPPPEGSMSPPPDFQPPPPGETTEDGSHSSLPSGSLLANVLFMIESLFGAR